MGAALGAQVGGTVGVIGGGFLGCKVGEKLCKDVVEGAYLSTRDLDRFAGGIGGCIAGGAVGTAIGATAGTVLDPLAYSNDL